jgi:putative SOS response-associated peptidase YedK
MCYYNGQKVTRAEFIQLKALERKISERRITRKIQSGFEYTDAFIMVPTEDRKHFDLIEAHWELIPDFVRSTEELPEFRQGKKDPVTGKLMINPRTKKPMTGYNTLNAKGETILSSPMYKQSALNGRCLILSSGFYEWMHLPGKKTIPHHIKVKDREYFFIAGISKPWADKETGETITTFSMVTTEANPLMEKIHNTKKRQPTILTEDLAYEWLLEDLSEARIKEIATYQFPAEQMEAYTIRKDFQVIEDPTEPYQYAELSPDLFS